MANLQPKITAAMYRQMYERAKKRAAALEAVYDEANDDERNYIIEHHDGRKVLIYNEVGGKRISKARHLWYSAYELANHYKRLMRAFTPNQK